MKSTNSFSLTLLAAVLIFPAIVPILAMACAAVGSDTQPAETDRTTISSEMQRVLLKELGMWYPRSIDSLYGGFFSDFDSKWELDGRQNKMIVTQARHVWTGSTAAMFYQTDNFLRDVAGHGFEFLRNVMWDKQYGGCYDLVDRYGKPFPENGEIIKRAYGNAFVIYGLAAYYRTSGDTNSLHAAQDAFMWMDKHSYDPLYGGYFQFMKRDGTPFVDGYEGTPPKDYNSMIHILEAFTELYHVWPDTLVRTRLESLLHILRDKTIDERGFLELYFTRGWRHISYRDASNSERESHYEFDHVSFGHDVETAYLMLEASEALGHPNDPLTLQVGKKMVDHALENGWDVNRGGLYDGGYYVKGQKKLTIVRDTKEWWSQAEALNSFLMMSEFYPDDPHKYYEKFCIQWEYCKKYLIDSVNGGWYWGGTDIVPGQKKAPKASIWKCNYHTSRAMINCINRIGKETLTFGSKQHDPVNPAATPEAKKLLAYLYSIYGKNIVAGHHNYIEKPDTFITCVKELTGKSPEIYGLDFGGYWREGYGERVVQEAYKKYKEGYIITLMWHAGRPQDNPPFGWKESVQAKMTDAQWQELITPGSPLHERWQNQIDTVAGFLKELRDLGVPVLWRPYHEANGVWFWWGNRRGPDGSAKLYTMMFDRYVNHHKLNNLIWVWNTNAPRQLIRDEAYDYKEFSPGSEYVDVLATDVYHNDYRQSHHDELYRLGKGKIVSLGEVGEVPTPEILKEQPMWAWFMIWSNFVTTHNTPAQIRALYDYPGTITHESYVSQK